MHIAVVGAGIMGLCAAWALARRGHSVSVFDRAKVPNPHGSSVDRHRLIRHPYGGEDGYCRMVDEAFAAWDRLWADLGQRLYVETGALALATEEGGDWMARTVAGLDRCGVPWERLAPGTLAARFPWLDTTGVAWGARLRPGGALLADRIVAALADRLRADGHAIHEGTTVTGVDPEAGSLTVAGKRIAADRVIVAAGPWAGRLLPGVARRVTPSRQAVLYVEPPADLAAALARAPMLLDIGADAALYIVPPHRFAGSSIGMKIGTHSFSLTGDPDDDRIPHPDEIAALAAAAARRLRGFARYGIGECRICYYDVAGGERFIVEPLGARGWVATGFSGHGFKFGAVLGERLADAVEGTMPASELADWAGGRRPSTRSLRSLAQDEETGD